MVILGDLRGFEVIFHCLMFIFPKICWVLGALYPLGMLGNVAIPCNFQ
jgi:hypothetical protein